MKSFKDVVKENWGPESTGKWTSQTSGQTWSPATQSPPYKTMSGPIGGYGGTQPSLADQDAVMGDLEHPEHLPFPLTTTAEQLANAIMALADAKSQLHACKQINPVVDGQKEIHVQTLIDNLDKAIELIKKTGIDISKIALNVPS